LGPTTINIHSYLIDDQNYHTEFKFDRRKTQVQMEDGQMFHPRLPTKTQTHTYGSGHRQYTLQNLVSLQFIQSFAHGIVYVHSVKVKASLYCSVDASAHAQLDCNIHTQLLPYQIFHVEPIVASGAKDRLVCTERFADSNNKISHFTTSVIVTKVENKTLYIVLHKTNIDQQHCKPRERISILEMHPHLDIVYEYRFTNTVGKRIFYQMSGIVVRLLILKHLLRGFMKRPLNLKRTFSTILPGNIV
jgi:hypothetical protein